jgi:hypothetical protein
MSEVDDLVQQAVAALKAGRKDEARNLLMEAVDKDEHHEQGWLWLSALVDTLEEQQICLENVLAINPDNERARKGLDAVNQKITAPRGGSAPKAPADTATSQAPAPSPQPVKGSSSVPIGAEFASLSGDQLLGDSPASAEDGFSFSPQKSADNDNTFEGWAAFATPDQPTAPPSPEPPAPSTSVDWVQSEGPVAHGSGKQVDLPSDQEYDNWVQSLNLAGTTPESPAQPGGDTSTSFPGGEASPFGDTSFMAEADMAAPTRQANSDAFEFGGDIFGSESFSWDSEATPFGQEVPTTSPPAEDSLSIFGGQGDPFGESTVPGFEADLGTEDPFAGDAAADDSMFSPAEQEGELVFDFDADDDDDLWSDADLDDDEPVQARRKVSTVNASAYYQYIPSGIEPAAVKFDGNSLVLLGGVLLLMALNILSFAFLLSSL